jgi:hypothetical protein
MAAAQTALMRNDARARCSPPLAVGRKTYGSEALALMGRERNALETMTVSGRRVLIFGAGNCYDPYLPAADADEGVGRESSAIYCAARRVKFLADLCYARCWN